MSDGTERLERLGDDQALFEAHIALIVAHLDRAGANGATCEEREGLEGRQDQKACRFRSSSTTSLHARSHGPVNTPVQRLTRPSYSTLA